VAHRPTVGKKLAFAHNFAFMRHAVAEDAVKATAFQNGVIGVVAVIRAPTCR